MPPANYTLVDTFLRWQPHQHVVGGAEQLHLCILEPGGEEVIADCFHIGVFGIADFEQDTSGEVDAEVEPAHPQ